MVLDSTIFFKIWKQILSFALGTPWVLSEKHNSGKGYPRRNLKINDENQR